MGFVYPVIIGHASFGVISTTADAIAAIVGSTLKGYKLPYHNKKTIMGSLSFLIACLILGYLFKLNIKGLLMSSIIGTLTEGYCKCLDNLYVPMIMVHTYAYF